MKKVILSILVISLGFLASGCGRDQSDANAEVGQQGVLGPVLSEEKGIEVKEKPVRQIAKPSSRNTVVAADFNSGTKPSNIGGDFGTWDKDPADFSQSCTDSFDPITKYGPSGFSMKLDYDVDSPNPAYNGFWMKLGNLDASDFNNLVFYTKGDVDTGFTTVFKVELKNRDGEVGKFYVSGIDSRWQKTSIPLDQFHGIDDFSNLGEFVIVFEDRMATNKDGVIYIDDIQFTR